jgi:hypothetical protein
MMHVLFIVHSGNVRGAWSSHHHWRVTLTYSVKFSAGVGISKLDGCPTALSQ